MSSVTTFDTKAKYIFLSIFIPTKAGKRLEFDAILDTGAPNTEFSGQALQTAGFLEKIDKDIRLKSGLQTQKYGKITLPYIEICSQKINDFSVFVSHFEKSWGIDALIGLDFFRRFRVTVDYAQGALITEPYST